MRGGGGLLRGQGQREKEREDGADLESVGRAVEQIGKENGLAGGRGGREQREILRG